MVSSHIIKHHKRYFRGAGWSLFSFMTIKMIAIVGIAWLLPMVNKTFARPADGVRANNDYYETAISTTLHLNADAGVLINDSNTRGWTIISAFLDSWPSHWSLALNTDWSFEYIPNSNYNWVDIFMYHATNGVDGISTAQVHIQVGPVETPPVAWDNSYNIDENSVATIDSSNGVLRNAYDAEWDPMTAILDRVPFDWTVTLNDDWSFIYTPDQYFDWTDSFTYHLSDGKTTGNVATVQIVVNPIDDTYDPNTVIVPETSNENDIKSEFIAKEYTTGNLTIKSVADTNTLIGNKRIKLTASNWQIQVPLVMQSVSVANRVEAVIPAWAEAVNLGFGTNFQWTLNAPRMERTTLATEKWWLSGNIVSVASFGAHWEWSIGFRDIDGNNIDVLMRIPTPWLQSGTIAKIYYSDDVGFHWYEHSQDPYVNVISIWWIPYVEVRTTHFTLFSVEWLTWNFVINNDDQTTFSNTVLLTIDLPVAAQMRFSNDNSTRSDWEPYVTTTGWSLPWTYWPKTVYAQFDIDGDWTGDITTNDSINYTAPWAWSSHGSSTWNLRLQIITSSWSCSYGTSLYIGSHTSQFVAYDMTGSNFSSSFSCVDTEGLSGWTMTMEATTDLSDGAQTISKDNVSLIASPNYVSAGACTTGTNQDSWVSIGSTPGTILWKSSGQWDICTITSDTVNLAVHIPASQAVGLYTGTLSLNMPF